MNCILYIIIYIYILYVYTSAACEELVVIMVCLALTHSSLCLGHSVDSSPQMHLIEYLQAEGLV